MAETLYLLTWCPNQTPPAPCDPCKKCTWVSPDSENLLGASPNWITQALIARYKIANCHPKFGVMLFQDQSGIGGASRAWVGPAINANPLNGASATITLSYGGVTISTITGNVVLVGNGGSVPQEWLSTQFFQAIYSGGHFVENVLYYTVWNAPDDYITTGGFPEYGFVYDGPMTSDDPQIVTVTYAVSPGAVVVGGFPLEFYANSQT